MIVCECVWVREYLVKTKNLQALTDNRDSPVYCRYAYCAPDIGRINMQNNISDIDKLTTNIVLIFLLIFLLASRATMVSRFPVYK